jgi:dTDP-4-amino-4,6-dideoxygalactose transaminase
LQRATQANLQPIPMVDLRAQFASIEREVRAALDEVLASQQFVLGPQLAAFEREMAQYCGLRAAVGVASGTDALMLGLRACGVHAGDEVIVPAFTFVATAGAVSALGALPVFADIEPDTLGLSAESVAPRITNRTRAIVAVHFGGLAARMEPLADLATQHRLPLIEDNAQSLGASCNGRKAGSFGTMATTSFYPSKNLGAYGDAGMVLTDSEVLAARVKGLRNHGLSAPNLSSEPGWNSRLDEMQAAILRVKLQHLDRWIEKRQELAAHYDERFAATGDVHTPEAPPGCEHSYYLYTVRIPSAGNDPADRRNRVARHLAEARIASAVFYPVPLHLQPLYASLGGRTGDLPAAERAAGEVLSLPLYPEMTAEQVDRVANAVLGALAS